VHRQSSFCQRVYAQKRGCLADCPRGSGAATLPRRAASPRLEPAHLADDPVVDEACDRGVVQPRPPVASKRPAGLLGRTTGRRGDQPDLLAARKIDCPLVVHDGKAIGDQLHDASSIDAVAALQDRRLVISPERERVRVAGDGSFFG
jgi:hypothetical protein